MNENEKKIPDEPETNRKDATTGEEKQKRRRRKPTKDDRRSNRGGNSHSVISRASTDNDPAWYLGLSDLADSAGQLPYSSPVGRAIQTINDLDSYNQAGSTVTNGSNKYSTVPGIMAFDIAPTIGTADGPTSAANIAATQLYQMVRKANSGAINYEKTDLMMFVMAMDSAYMLYEELLRAYRCLGSYNYMNRYLPDALLAAIGFSPKLGASLADFRGVLDLFAYQLESVNVPDVFPFIRRHSWLFTNIYKDSPSNKSQLYAFRPKLLYVWEEADEQLTYLRAISRQFLYGITDDSNIVSSIDQIRTAIDSIMQPILGSQDVSLMCGDIMKAYGDGKMIKIAPVKSYEAVSPAFNEEVLTQIENAIAFPVATTSTFNITVNASSLITGPYLETHPAGFFSELAELTPDPWCAYFRNTLLNMHNETPSVGDNFVATRFIPVLGNTVPENNYIAAPFSSFGTEILTGITLYYYEPNSDGSVTPDNLKAITQKNDLNFFDEWEMEAEATTENLKFLAMLSAFNHHPTFYTWMVSRNGESRDVIANLLGVVQNIDNYHWLTKQEATKLNDVAVMSEFKIDSYSLKS